MLSSPDMPMWVFLAASMPAACWSAFTSKCAGCRSPCWQAVSIVGERKQNKWSSVAERVYGRSQTQCRERWCNVLDPTLKTGQLMLLASFHNTCNLRTLVSCCKAATPCCYANFCRRCCTCAQACWPDLHCCWCYCCCCYASGPAVLQICASA